MRKQQQQQQAQQQRSFSALFGLGKRSPPAEGSRRSSSTRKDARGRLERQVSSCSTQTASSNASTLDASTSSSYSSTPPFIAEQSMLLIPDEIPTRRPVTTRQRSTVASGDAFGSASSLSSCSEDEISLGSYSRPATHVPEQISEEQPEPPQRRTVVTFNEAANSVIPDTTTTNNANDLLAEEQDLWYSRRDYQRFKREHARLARKLVDANPEYVKALKAAYKACRQVPIETNFCVLTYEEEENLLRVLKTLTLSTNLEETKKNEDDNSNSSFASEDGDAKDLCVAVGLEVVSLCRKENEEPRQLLLKLLANSGAANSSSKDVRRLRKACETISRPWRLFARHLAQAHADLLKEL